MWTFLTKRFPRKPLWSRWSKRSVLTSEAEAEWIWTHRSIIMPRAIWPTTWEDLTSATKCLEAALQNPTNSTALRTRHRSRHSTSMAKKLLSISISVHAVIRSSIHICRASVQWTMHFSLLSSASSSAVRYNNKWNWMGNCWSSSNKSLFNSIFSGGPEENDWKSDSWNDSSSSNIDRCS